GARPGDIVAVAGRLGFAAAGFAVLESGLESPGDVVDAYRRPIVPYSAGPAAGRLGATAMLDVSDGLLADLGHVADASGVAIDIRRDAFDVPPPLTDAARALNRDPYTWILTGGDDHALAATFPRGVALDGEWRVIGEVTAGAGVTVDGVRYADAPAGWDHFG
ncbi:MAG TPA: AIR synthase-related protein, partial [Micromonosporaceae bacterium]